MAMFMHHPLAFVFGILGNITSFMVYLAPLPTFARVCKRKSTEGFQSVPYVVALFSAMLWLYYAMHKSSDYLLITINSAGCIIESIYIAIYIAYAPKQARVWTLELIFLLNFGGFFLIVLPAHFLAKGSNQAHVLGWVCSAISVSAFAAPLSIIRVVIRTKSVEFMPFYLSFSLTLSAIMWILYGMLLKDLFVAIPNVLGFILGVFQMLIYKIYKSNKIAVEEQKLPEHSADVVNQSTIKTSNETLPSYYDTKTDVKDQNVHDQTGCNDKSTEANDQGQLIDCPV